MKNLFLLPALLLAVAAQGQGLVSGRVLDRQTNQPVPYASISLLGTPFGTTSNAEGEFALNVSRLPARLVVGQLGYGRDTAAVAAAGALARPVTLAAAPVQLPDGEQSAFTAELIKKAYRVLVRDQARKQYGQAFYRQTSRLDNRPLDVNEMVWQVRATSAGLDGTALTQARYARKKDALVNYRNFSTITRNFSLLRSGSDTVRAGQILGPNPAEYYTLKLSGITQSGGQSVAQIAFEGKPAYNDKHVIGQLFIDIDTYQVLRFQATTDLKSSTNNFLFKLRNPRLTYDYVFRAGPDGAGPDHLLTSYSAMLGRPLKSDVQLAANGFTYFYDWRPTPTAGTNYAPANGKESDRDLIKAVAYDPAFWRDNPVVKRTPLEEEVIRSFEQEKAFGTMLDK